VLNSTFFSWAEMLPVVASNAARNSKGLICLSSCRYQSP
jgi:hypothetical protein